MLEAGVIQESLSPESGLSRRSRIVYAVTDIGRKRFEDISSSSEPDSWEDESFEVRFAFFGPTPQRNRLQILEGRHHKLVDKAKILRTDLEKSPEGLDRYLVEWRRHSLESAEREIAWLQEMINTERKST
jgi:DNA-binding PadR family transcriptional regulator